MSSTKRFSPARRTLLGGLASLCAAPDFSVDKAALPSKGPDTLWYRQSAARWEEALPLGNGRLGAMVFGACACGRAWGKAIAPMRC